MRHMKSLRYLRMTNFIFQKIGTLKKSLILGILFFWGTVANTEEFLFKDGTRRYGHLMQETKEYVTIRFYHEQVQLPRNTVQIRFYSSNMAIESLERLHPNQPEEYFFLGTFLITSPDALLHQQSRRVLLLALHWFPEKEEEILFLLATITNDPAEKHKYFLYLMLHYPETLKYQELFRVAQKEFLWTEERNYQVLKTETQLLIQIGEYYLQDQFEDALKNLEKASKHRVLSRLLREKIGFNYAEWIENLEANRMCPICKDTRQYACIKCEGDGFSPGECRRCKGSGRMPPSLEICSSCNGTRMEDLPCLRCKKGWLPCPRCSFRRKPALVPKNKVEDLLAILKTTILLNYKTPSLEKLPTEFDTPVWLSDPQNNVFLNGRWMPLSEKERLQPPK